MTQKPQAVLSKLAEYGLDLTATDDEMWQAFARCVNPQACMKAAKAMQKAERGC